MKKRYRALIEGKYIIQSVAKFDDAQKDDMERMIQEFVNIALKVVKENPKLLDEMVLPEPRTTVSQ